MKAASPTSVPVAQGLFTETGLVGGRCSSCGALQFPAHSMCPVCQSSEIAELMLSPTGTVFTFTIVRTAPPGYLGETPYAYGIVELPEGLRVTTTITADALDSIKIGARVRYQTITLAGGAEPATSFAYRVITEGAA